MLTLPPPGAQHVEHVLVVDVNLDYGSKMVHILHKMLITRF